MMSSRNEIAFIIVNYNSIQLLSNLLDSIRRTVNDIRSEIIVIDNNSADNSVGIIHSRYPEVLLIRNQENKGFGYACNQGIKASSADYFFLLNSDTELVDNSLLNIRRTILENDDFKNTGIFGFRLLNPDGSLQYSMGRFPTVFSTIVDMFKPPAKRKVYTSGYDQVRQVDWVTGACMLINRKTIENIGIFDENYFMYYEETDLCLRAKKAGWAVVFHPGISIIHKYPHAQKKDKIPLRIRIEIRRSHLYFFRKNRSYFSFMLLFAATMIILYSQAFIYKLVHRPASDDHKKLIQAVIDQFLLLNRNEWEKHLN